MALVAAVRRSPAPVAGLPLAPFAAPGAAGRADTRPRAWPYVVAGAVIGGVATTIWIAREVRRADAFLAPPILLAVPIGGGTALGALGGWVVYEIRH